MAAGKYQKWLTPEGLTLLKGWARAGLTDEQMARKMGVACATLYDWKNKYPEISEALKKGKEVVDTEVENALLKRALGYEYTETMVEHSADGVKRRTTVKFIPPDVTAQIFWLKNRRPEARRVRMIEQAANEVAPPSIAEAIITSACDGVPYEKMRKRPPCGRNQFYTMRMDFFIRLDGMLWKSEQRRD